MLKTFDDHEDLTRALERGGRTTLLAEAAERGLHALNGTVPHDLAVLYERRGDRLEARAAVGRLATEEIRGHVLELERFATLRRALETRDPVARLQHDQVAEGDLYQGVLQLPLGHASLVVPLFVSDESLGVLALDREAAEAYSGQTLVTASLFGRVLAIAIAEARRADRLECHRHHLEDQLQLLGEELGTPAEAGRQVEACVSATMRERARLARQVAETDVPVLLRGEPGTGTRALARAIHGWSRRAARPLLRVDAAAVPGEAIGRVLFGHGDGTHEHGVGRVLLANHGTLLVENVGQLPLTVQDRLLQLLLEGRFEPWDSSRSHTVDVRLVATCHEDPEAAVRAGRLRRELLQRLGAFMLELPPLRERSEDVAPLADLALAVLGQRRGGGPWTLSPGARDLLAAAKWPGNVDELFNVLEHATLVLPRGVIEPQHLSGWAASVGPGTPLGGSAGGALLPLREAERQHLVAALQHTGGKIYGRDGAARLLDLKPTTLQSKLKKLRIDRLQVVGTTGSEGSEQTA